MLKLMIELIDKDFEAASHVVLYPDTVMTVAQALAAGPTPSSYELGYLGSPSGAIGFALASEYFDRKDQRQAEEREAQVEDLLLVAKTAARPFPVTGWRELRNLVSGSLFREGPMCDFDVLVPKNASSWIGSRKPRFSGVSVGRENRLRKNLKQLERNWVLPEWFQFVELENEGVRFTLARDEIVSVKFFDDALN
jgi:hypothetical protein